MICDLVQCRCHTLIFLISKSQLNYLGTAQNINSEIVIEESKNLFPNSTSFFCNPDTLTPFASFTLTLNIACLTNRSHSYKLLLNSFCLRYLDFCDLHCVFYRLGHRRPCLSNTRKKLLYVISLISHTQTEPLDNR